MKTPVALIIFNRPDTTARVFDAIAGARPRKLFVIADGPRQDRPEDATKCAAARAIVERVDWDCEVVKNYSDVNLGCGQRPASGITWLFQKAEEAIILEDDCLPDPTFFRFCDELLQRYGDDERVMMISGNNFQDGRKYPPNSYYFSNYTHPWGWATWRRAWQHFDLEMKLWRGLRETDWLVGVLGDQKAAAYWRTAFDSLNGTSDVWDYQWAFACWVRKGLAALPDVNLVTNIGWGAEATHTRDPGNPAANCPTAAMQFPLVHPTDVVRNIAADNYTFRKIFADPTLYLRVCRKLSALVNHRLFG